MHYIIRPVTGWQETFATKEAALKRAAQIIENDEEQENAIIYIGQLMRSFHSTWNRDNFDDGIIIDDIKTLSKGKLHIDLEKVRENALFESNTRRDFKIPHVEEEQSGKKKHNHGKKHRNGHKKRR